MYPYVVTTKYLILNGNINLTYNYIIYKCIIFIIEPQIGSQTYNNIIYID